jgi:hypothetical protein
MTLSLSDHGRALNRTMGKDIDDCPLHTRLWGTCLPTTDSLLHLVIRSNLGLNSCTGAIYHLMSLLGGHTALSTPTTSHTLRRIPRFYRERYLTSRDRYEACCENRVITQRRPGSTLGTASSDLTGFRSSSVKLDSSPIHPEMGCTITLCHQNSGREAHDIPISAAVYFTYRRGLHLRIMLACGRSLCLRERKDCTHLELVPIRRVSVGRGGW